ncbi:hypothetical protein DXT99_20350 [Pontibacter diazotrophicus]|uniref:Uncharacterized protein n=1 Tax=Pontibacter diazotrophicus TaxID=1400979 RepID=A0A3D8L8Q9_9BACT|nr:hypothetical protein [Pontibacter diazotrophicus]RDV13372.1 hypothetical protein DXT99_20350 [Pontibacter diazotrophicus]
MIEVEKLNSADKSKVKLEMKQVLVSYLAIGIIVAIVTAASAIFIQKNDNLPIGKGTVITLLLLTIVSGFAAFLYCAVKDYLKDLKSNSKRVYSGQITDKPTNTNWGWHGNPAADSNSQPKLIEYSLVVDSQRVRVEEEEYNRVEIGDRVSLHFTSESNILLEVKKELRSGNKAQA